MGLSGVLGALAGTLGLAYAQGASSAVLTQIAPWNDAEWN